MYGVHRVADTEQALRKMHAIPLPFSYVELV